MRWLLIILFLPLASHCQQEINIRQFTFVIPDSVIYGDTCHMSMHGYFHCNDITTQYFEIKNDTLYYYMLKTEDDRYTNYKYISIESCPLSSIDTTASYVWQDKYSPKYWSTVIELRRNTKRKNKIWNKVYWKTGKCEKSTQWRTSIQSWSPGILDKIKWAVKNIGSKK